VAAAVREASLAIGCHNTEYHDLDRSISRVLRPSRAGCEDFKADTRALKGTLCGRDVSSVNSTMGAAVRSRE
jgi:hypothetical protein